MKKYKIIVSLLFAYQLVTAQQFDYYPLLLSYNIGQDSYKLSSGQKFSNSDNFPAISLVRSNSGVFLLAEMDWIAGFQQQTNYTATSSDSIYSNNFQLFNVVMGFYKKNDKKVRPGFVFCVDATTRNASSQREGAGYLLGNSTHIIASPAGFSLGVGFGLQTLIKNQLAVTHNLGIAALGNARNDPNWIGRNIFYLGNATYPITGRIAANGYLNIENIHFINHQSLSNDSEGNLLHWSLRVGLGVHLGKTKMIEK